MQVTVSRLLVLVSVVLFVLVAFGGHIGSMNSLELLGLGLAFFAAAHLT